MSIRVLESVRREGCVGSLEPGSNSLRRVVGELDADLEQGNRELGMDLSCHPQTEGWMRVLGLENDVNQLNHELQAQVTVLEEDPAPILHEVGEESPRMNLLSLTH